MAFNRQGNQGGEKMNTPIGGERKSSMFFVTGKGKLVARGTFDVNAMHQAIETASQDPRNTKPGQISVALFETDNQGFGILVCSPVRASTGGRQGEGFQRNQGQYNAPPPQQAPQYAPPAPQQWGQQQAPSWGPPPQQAPSFQERYAQGAPLSEDTQERHGFPEVPHVTPAKKAPAKKAAAKAPAKKGKK